ncbi:inner membrane amino-acid ABC transporter permease protein YhdY [bacterium BMS3Bbin10]|nr:inner membrane amino-acid ABC transporter permease protein YhdY [bacterium BMS3Bbin10]
MAAPGTRDASGDRTAAIPEKKRMDVLLPIARRQQSQAMIERLEGTFRLNLQPHHAIWMLLLFVLTVGTAQAQAPKELISPIEALIKWMPFILWGQEGTLNGFALNLMISFFAMLFGTVAGVTLGLMQISLLLPVRKGSWLVTQFFRNSPWLVLLFTIMLLFPFEIDLGFAIIPVPDWMKAVIGFALPVMANISEVVRGAVRSLPTGQWESAESLAFSRRQTLWMIILPQCFKRMIPPWINWYCILAMATPLASIMGVEESVSYTAQAMNAEGDRPELLPVFYLFLLVIFFVYTYPIARWSIRLEKKFTIKT